jgi:AsmA family
MYNNYCDFIMKKKIIISIILALVLAFVATIIYVSTNTNSILKAAIEKYGSQTTKTAVRVSSAMLKLSSGEGAVLGLTIADPPGFSFPSVITLDNIAIRVAVKTVTKKVIVIDSILVSGPDVFYELKEDGTANVDVLKKNIISGPPSTEEKTKKKPGKEIKLHIRKLLFEKGRIHVRVAKPLSRPYILQLPRLELLDIGRHGGATPEAIARTVAYALAEETARAVARARSRRPHHRGAPDLRNKYINK